MSAKKLVAVTACPTGIAHSFMAAKKIESWAAKHGYEVKVETQGSDGVKNKLTAQDIASADAVVLAVDVPIDEMERFDNTNATKVRTQELIKHVDTILPEALKRDKAKTTVSSTPVEEKRSAYQVFIGHIMTGISYMLPIVVLGGLLMAVAKITGEFIDIEGTAFQRLDMLGFMTMKFMYPVFAAYLAYSIAGKPALVPALIGGVMTDEPYKRFFGMEELVPSGFFGAIAIGFLVGYLVRFLNDNIKIKDEFTTLKTMLLVPLITGVVDYCKVDPNLGDWPELNKLADHFDLMYDCVINHISKSSDWFQKFLAGDEQHQDYFAECDPEQDYSSVTRPRALPLLTPFTKADGSKVHVWTTFSDDQIDINFASPKVLLESIRILLTYAANGGRSIRLDAIGFIWKVLGTSCIHLPEAHEIIKLWRIILDEVCEGTLLITETNVPHKENISYFGHGDEAHMVYQFPLPPLTMHAFLRENTGTLTRWAKTLTAEAMSESFAGRKMTFFNFLASHDGVGVRPTEGILDDGERQFMAEEVYRKGGKVNFKHNPDGSQSPYELNINYLSAITEPSDSDEVKARKFIAAQSLLLSFVGVPAIYYHSFLGSENDIAGMEESGINRRINREKLDIDQLEKELAETGSLRQRVYSELVRLLNIRKQYKAFAPQSVQRVLELDNGLFALERGDGSEKITYVVNMTSETRNAALEMDGFDLVSEQNIDRKFELAAGQFVWVKH